MTSADAPAYVPCSIEVNHRTLDAGVLIAWYVDRLRVLFESRSGAKSGGRARNTEYLPALELVLARLGQVCAVVERIDVVSRYAMRLAPEKRVLPMKFPIELHRDVNFAALRLNMTEMQRATARTSRAKDGAGGNNTKRIELQVRLASPLAGDLRSIERLLATGDGPARDVPNTDD